MAELSGRGAPQEPEAPQGLESPRAASLKSAGYGRTTNTGAITATRGP
jgi:hypothetical protein